MTGWGALNQTIIACDRCPRLRDHCRKTAQQKRRAFQAEDYWGQPVPNFGPRKAAVLIVGLAPAAHGANRTGRMFTGDRSGDWLFRALCKAGFASQANSEGMGDGLRMVDCAITAVCHCAPPENKPSTSEIANCQPFLSQTIRLNNPRVIVALGGLAWTRVLHWAVHIDGMVVRPRPKFGHGNQVSLPKNRKLLGSYHPSQQNTFTGRLTEPMFDAIFEQARELAAINHAP